MSLDATRWAWQQTIRPSHKLVLLSLADRAGPDHSVWPSYSQLEADTGLDRKTISQAIGQMISIGLMEDTGERKGKTKQIPVYKLIGVSCRAEDKQYRKRNDSEIGTVPLFPLNSTENGTRNLPIEPIKESNTGKHRFDAIEFLLGHGANKQLVIDWFAVRKTKKQANTKTAMDGFIREVRKAGLTIDKALEVCCIKGWAGFMASWPRDEEQTRDDWRKDFK